ncbi:GNAT family N-acetyltransferase [Nonomuraea sp. NPDC048916]|uniref:GNAT family N-acetyltransferase n=1 Tax=Nonomuraea sp. NPDC048916 TaxID=3154232 RepID=UPI0033E1240E
MKTIDDETLGHLHAAYVQAVADQPGPVMSARRFRLMFTQERRAWQVQSHVEHDGDEVVAGYRLSLPTLDNTHLGWLDPLFVRPDRRGRGLGSALLGAARDRLRAGGRRLLLAETPAVGTGARFARAHGFTVSLTEARRTLELGEVDWHRFRRMLPRPQGYELELWTGPAGPEQLADLAVLMGGMNDAPLGEEMEDAVYDVERVRAQEELIVSSGCNYYTAIARRVSDGAPAGFTRLFVDADRTDGWASQADTAVLRPHRGHRLGLLLKLANLIRMREREPQVERIITWNATSNTHMLAINETMGFKLLDAWHIWQLRA